MGNQTIKIIYISANPKNTGNIDSDEEYMQIKNALDKGKNRDSFILENPIFRAKLKDLADSLTKLNSENCIIHFSGHGNPLGNFILEQVDGSEKEIEPTRIAEYLGNYKQNLYGIVYSACYSDDLASTTNKTTGSFTIGFETPVSVSAAALFSYNFYLELLNSINPKDAFGKANSFSKLHTGTNHLANFYDGKKVFDLDNDKKLAELYERKEIFEKISELERNNKMGVNLKLNQPVTNDNLNNTNSTGTTELIKEILDKNKQQKIEGHQRKLKTLYEMLNETENELLYEKDIPLKLKYKQNIAKYNDEIAKLENELKALI